MAISNVCGAECGLSPSSNNGVVGTRHWGTMPGTTAPAISTTHVRTGNYAYKFTPGAAAPYIIRAVTAGTYTVVGGRFYFYFDAFPVSASESILSLTLAAGTSLVAIVTSGGILKMGDQTLGLDTGPTISTAQWVGIEFQLDVRADPNVITWRTDVGNTGTWADQGSISLSQANTTLSQFRIGLPSATTGTENLWIDDIVLYEGTTINEHYPIGSGYVKAYKTNASSVGLSATGDLKYNNTTNIVGGATDLHTYVDDVDGSSHLDLDAGITDYISFNVADATDDVWTRYAQFQFEDSVESAAPRYVNLLTVFHSASTAANELNTRVSDDGTTWTTVWGAWTASTNVGIDVSETTALYLSKVIPKMPSTAGSWTTNGFNSIRIQVGHSDDINPVPFVDVVGIEAEFAPIPLSPSRTNPLLRVSSVATERAARW